MRIPHTTPRRVAIAAAVFSLVLATSACGGGDDGNSDDAATPPAAADTDSNSDTDTGSGTDDGAATVDSGGLPGGTIGEINDIGDLAGAIGGDELTDAISSLGIFTKAGAIATALGGEAQEVDDTTARILLDGDVNSDALVACIVVGAIIDETDTIILVYPNGETDCSD